MHHQRVPDHSCGTLPRPVDAYAPPAPRPRGSFGRSSGASAGSWPAAADLTWGGVPHPAVVQAESRLSARRLVRAVGLIVPPEHRLLIENVLT